MYENDYKFVQDLCVESTSVNKIQIQHQKKLKYNSSRYLCL